MTNIPMLATSYLDPLNLQAYEHPQKESLISTLRLILEDPSGKKCREELRESFEESQKSEPNPEIICTNFNVSYADQDVRTYIFRQKDLTGCLPVIFFIHGGGWAVGSVNTHRKICEDLALKTRYAVVFPEYALAPEAKWPIQHKQCFQVIKDVVRNGLSYGLDPKKLAVVGDSAGGQISVAVTILCSREESPIPISFQVLLSPAIDMVVTLRRDPFRNGLPFDQNLLKILFASYFGVENIPSIYCNDQLLRLASPRHISTEDARNQPQTLIINSSADIVSDDGIIYGQILQNAGVACTVFTALGQVHDSAVLKATRNGPTARTIVRLVAAEIREAIESPKPALQHEAKATISTVDSNGTSH